MLTVEECEAVKGDTFVAEVEAFDRLPSTSDRALQRARDASCQKPLLVVARHQTGGRGRGVNRWWSSDGALTFSLLLDGAPTRDARPAPLVSLAVGVAVCDAVAALDPELDVGLKWPNDVYLSGRKLAGVLIERPSHRMDDLVIGIGVNVNNSMGSAPAELSSTATSLLDVTGRAHELTVLLIQLLQRVEDQLRQLHDDPRRLRERWSRRCVLQGRHVVVAAGNRRVSGACRGIDDDGALVIQTESGPVPCSSGVVQMIQ